MKFKISFLIVFLLMSFRLAFADTYGGFSMQAVIPDNQVDKSKTYFDLRMEPEQKQTVDLIVRNGGDKAITAHLKVHTASTGRNGVIVYSPDIKNEEGLTVSVSEIAKVVPSEVSVPAGGETIVKVEIDMPNKAFDGCILGGIHVMADVAGENAAISQEGLQIENNYAYTMGLKITQNDNPVEADIILRDIAPATVNYRPMVNLNLLNNSGVIIKGMKLTGQVYKGDSDEVLKRIEMTAVDMAPHSAFDAGIDWNDMPIEAGEYRLILNAEYGDKAWDWEEGFAIEPVKANVVNMSSVYVDKNISKWIYAAVGVVVILLIFFIAYFLGRRKRKEV